MIDYNSPEKFVLDALHFSYRGEIFKGNGFMEWNPIDGFHIDAFLDKKFAPVDRFKTLGQTIINDKSDAFTIWLKIRGFFPAIAPNVFPMAQKMSFVPDNSPRFFFNALVLLGGITRPGEIIVNKSVRVAIIRLQTSAHLTYPCHVHRGRHAPCRAPRSPMQRCGGQNEFLAPNVETNDSKARRLARPD